jgi:hypothetical protein
MENVATPTPAPAVNKAQQIRLYKESNPTATPQMIADALGVNLQYVYTVTHKAAGKKPKAPKTVKPTLVERQMAKGQQILRDEINNLHRQITRLKLHNEMLQSMLKVQEFDLMHGHGAPV